MFRSLRFAFSMVFVVGLACQATAGDDKGFKPLFNGKDLTGWKTFLKDEKADPAKTLVVKDGEIRVSPDGQTIAVVDGKHITLLGRDAVPRATLDRGGSVGFLDDGTLVSREEKRLTHWNAKGELLGELALADALAI